jgi:hypothetical protein
MTHISKLRRSKAKVRSALAGVAFWTAATSTWLMAASAPSVNWKIEQLQPGAPGKFASLKIDTNGNAHLAFVSVDGDRNPLIYGFWDHSLKRWFNMTVAEHAGFCWLVLDSHQRPHISYADAGGGKGSKLRYAYWDGTQWKKQAIQVNADVIGYYTSITLDTNDNPTLSFYEYEGPGNTFGLLMRTATWNGKYWEIRTVDGQRGSGKFNSLANNSGRAPHLAYANVQAETMSLRYSHWNGGRWETQILEGLPGTPLSVDSVAIAVDPNDNPHIAYTDWTYRVVKYATRQDGKWSFQVVDSLTDQAFPDRNGITVDDQGNPFITYYDAGLGVLKLAFRQGGKWVTEIVDQNYAGETSSVQVSQGTIWIAYSDGAEKGLRVASAALADRGLLTQAGSAGSH